MCNFYVQNMLYLGVWGLRKKFKTSLRLNLLAILAKSLLEMYCFNE